MYILMFIAAIVLRYKKPHVPLHLPSPLQTQRDVDPR